MVDYPKNIADFDAAVAAILAPLYTTFPRKEMLDAGALASDQDTDTLENYSGAVEYLQTEGFLTFGQRAGRYPKFSQVVLTAKGLAMLRAAPGSLKVRASIGEQLVTAVRS